MQWRMRSCLSYWPSALGGAIASGFKCVCMGSPILTNSLCIHISQYLVSAPIF